MDKNNLQTIVCKYASLNYLWGLWESEKYAVSKYCSPSDKIIDIGCGAGRISINLYELGYKNITGIDILKSMIIQAKKETPKDYKIYKINIDSNLSRIEIKERFAEEVLKNIYEFLLNAI